MRIKAILKLVLAFSLVLGFNIGITGEQGPATEGDEKPFVYSGMLSALNTKTKAITIKTKNDRVTLYFTDDSDVSAEGKYVGGLSYGFKGRMLDDFMLRSSGVSVGDKVDVKCYGTKRSNKIVCDGLNIKAK